MERLGALEDGVAAETVAEAVFLHKVHLAAERRDLVLRHLYSWASHGGVYCLLLDTLEKPHTISIPLQARIARGPPSGAVGGGGRDNTGLPLFDQPGVSPAGAWGKLLDELEAHFQRR